MNAHLITRLARKTASVVTATAIGVGVLVAGGGTAHADDTYNALYGMGATVGGSTGPSYYSPAQFYTQTTCNAAADTVTTTVTASPRNGSSGQWFLTRTWAQDYGQNSAWKNYGWSQTFVSESNSMSYSMADYKVTTRQAFYGYQGHSYRIFVEGYVWNGGGWESLGSKWSNHFTTWGASEPNIYGQTLQSIPGSSSSYCTVL